MAADVTRAITPAVLADAPDTIKEVDAAEMTIRFAQEIYDRGARLISVHEKFPIDLGHREL